MERVLIQQILDTLPTVELEPSLTSFLTPLLHRLPDRRLQRVVPLAVRASSPARRHSSPPWPKASRAPMPAPGPPSASTASSTTRACRLAASPMACITSPAPRSRRNSCPISSSPSTLSTSRSRLPGDCPVSVSTVYKTTPSPLGGKGLPWLLFSSGTIVCPSVA